MDGIQPSKPQAFVGTLTGELMPALRKKGTLVPLIGHPNHGWSRIGHLAKLLFAFPQPFLGQLLVGHVERDPVEADWTSVGSIECASDRRTHFNASVCGSTVR